MPAKKGQVKTGGRKKGTQNKCTTELKAMTFMALQKAGGTDYLLEQAKENPTAFLTFLGKFVPKDVNANITGEMDHNWTFKVIKAKK